MTPATARRGDPMADELRRLAGLARRLLPDRRDPEAFHVQRDEIERGLRRLASRIEKGAA